MRLLVQAELKNVRGAKCQTRIWRWFGNELRLVNVRPTFTLNVFFVNERQSIRNGIILSVGWVERSKPITVNLVFHYPR